jgi:hypothetical protein
MDFAGAPASFVQDIHPGVEYFSSEALARTDHSGWGQMVFRHPMERHISRGIFGKDMAI